MRYKQTVIGIGWGLIRPFFTVVFCQLANLWSLGCLTDEDLQKFYQDGTKLSGHPPVGWIPEFLFATGSLGHGLSLSNGLALGKKLKGEPGRLFCLLSDGEWNEGANWEALIFAVHQKLILQFPERDLFLRGVRAFVGFKHE